MLNRSQMRGVVRSCRGRPGFLGLPQPRHTVLVELARTGSTPSQSRAGKVRLVPPPARVFRTPPPKPASRATRAFQSIMISGTPVPSFQGDPALPLQAQRAGPTSPGRL